jgi:hypothetical protein
MKRRFTSFTVRLPEGLAVAVQNAAREQGVSRSDILRSALTVFLGVSADKPLTDPRQLSLAETLADFPDLADVDPLNLPDLPDLPEFDYEALSRRVTEMAERIAQILSELEQ